MAFQTLKSLMSKLTLILATSSCYRAALFRGFQLNLVILLILVTCKEINPSTTRNIIFWLLNQSIMFLESHQQILYWVSPATKHHEAKILFLRSIETFKVRMEGLQSLLCLFGGKKSGTDACCHEMTKSLNQRLVSLSCCYLSSNNSL